MLHSVLKAPALLNKDIVTSLPRRVLRGTKIALELVVSYLKHNYDYLHLYRFQTLVTVVAARTIPSGTPIVHSGLSTAIVLGNYAGL